MDDEIYKPVRHSPEERRRLGLSSSPRSPIIERRDLLRTDLDDDEAQEEFSSLINHALRLVPFANLDASNKAIELIEGALQTLANSCEIDLQLEEHNNEPIFSIKKLNNNNNNTNNDNMEMLEPAGELKHVSSVSTNLSTSLLSSIETSKPLSVTETKSLPSNFLQNTSNLEELPSSLNIKDSVSNNNNIDNKVNDDIVDDDDDVYLFQHLLIKFKACEKPFSWRDPQGVRITNTNRADAVSEMQKMRGLITRGRAKMTDLAHKFSDCDFSHNNDGYISRRMLRNYPPELLEAAEAMSPGELSAVLETSHGLHLLYRISDPKI